MIVSWGTYADNNEVVTSQTEVNLNFRHWGEGTRIEVDTTPGQTQVAYHDTPLKKFQRPPAFEGVRVFQSK